MLQDAFGKMVSQQPDPAIGRQQDAHVDRGKTQRFKMERQQRV